MFENKEAKKVDRNSRFNLIVEKVELWTAIISIVVLSIAYSGRPQGAKAKKTFKDMPREQAGNFGKRDYSYNF